MTAVVKGKFGKKKHRGFSVQPELGELGWRPSEFYVPSTDAQGHSARAIVMVMPEMKRQIQTVIAKGMVPNWKTESDLLRWAIAVGLETLLTKIDDKTIKNMHGKAMLWVELQRQSYDQTYWESTLNSIADMVAVYVRAGRYPTALKTLKAAEGLIETIEDDYWKERYEAKFASLYRQVKAKRRGSGGGKGID